MKGLDAKQMIQYKKIKAFDFVEHSENCQVCQQFHLEIETNSSNNNVETADTVSDDDGGTQEEDEDECQNITQPSFAFHLHALKEVCSLCGLRVNKLTKFQFS